MLRLVPTLLSLQALASLVLALLPIDAIVIDGLKSRRAALSSAISSIATLTIANEAKATNEEERIVVPGTGLKAPLRNLVVGEEEASTLTSSPWRKPNLITQLGKSRIGAEELSPLSPSLVPFASDNELFYGTYS